MEQPEQADKPNQVFNVTGSKQPDDYELGFVLSSIEVKFHKIRHFPRKAVLDAFGCVGFLLLYF